MKRALIILALVLVVALPFALRPKKSAIGKADATVVIITPHNAGPFDEYAKYAFPILDENMRCFLAGEFGKMINLAPHRSPDKSQRGTQNKSFHQRHLLLCAPRRNR